MLFNDFSAFLDRTPPLPLLKKALYHGEHMAGSKKHNWSVSCKTLGDTIVSSGSSQAFCYLSSIPETIQPSTPCTLNNLKSFWYLHKRIAYNVSEMMTFVLLPLVSAAVMCYWKFQLASTRPHVMLPLCLFVCKQRQVKAHVSSDGFNVGGRIVQTILSCILNWELWVGGNS